MQWPEGLPQSCPPNEAECLSVVAYRFFEDDKTIPENFLTVRELTPHRKFPEPEKECRACSISIFTDKEEVIRLQNTIPRWRRSVGVVNIDPTSGKVKHTPSVNTTNSHHSWWTPIGLVPSSLLCTVIKPKPPENT
jgi:hypothetical protein